VFRISKFLGLPDPDTLFRGYGSGSGSFHHQAKIVRKTLISNVLRLLYDFLPLKNDVNVPTNSNKQKTDPDPLARGTDPEHCERINMIWFLDAQWFKNETHTDLMNSNLTVLSSIISSPLMPNLALKFLGFYINGTLIEVKLHTFKRNYFAPRRCLFQI
jgi:hypothetical protein